MARLMGYLDLRAAFITEDPDASARAIRDGLHALTDASPAVIISGDALERDGAIGRGCVGYGLRPTPSHPLPIFYGGLEPLSSSALRSSGDSACGAMVTKLAAGP